MKGPPRLLDDPRGAPGELRQAMEQLQTALPDADRIASLAAKLGVAALPPPDLAAAVAKPAAPVTKLLATLGIGGAVLGGAYAFTRSAVAPRAAETALVVPLASGAAVPSVSTAADRTTSAPVAARREADLRPPAAAGADPHPDRPAPAAVISTPAPAPPSAAVARRAAAAEAPAPASGRAASSPASAAEAALDTKTGAPLPASRLSETELLGDARAALARSPALALTFCEQHRREFPKGVFVQEREVIAITALSRLGRRAEARSRAERFERSYPRSAYLRQLEGVLGGNP